MRLTLRLLLIIPLALSAASAARAEPPARAAPKVQISAWQLSNGLRVLHSRMGHVPAVNVQLWYHAGSKDERPGIRGVAHMFEHMMFKGSARLGPEEHARMLAGLGGSVNAYTTADVTVYWDTVPRDYLDFALQLEAERMRDLRLTEKTIKSEREVVKEEKRLRLENSPIGRALEAIHATAYTRHPYAWTPAGHMEDLNAITMQQCQAFYDTYYGPDNATLVVVGDVTEAEVRAAAERWFGAVPRGKQPPRVTTREPPQAALRRVNADWPSQLNVVLGAYHIPAMGHADMPALRVMSAVLSAGRSSRLNQALVRKGKVAMYAGGFAREQEHPGLLMIFAVGLPAHDLKKMEDALLAEVERVAQGGVTERELTRAKNKLSTQLLGGLRTPSGLGSMIGRSAVLRGDPQAFLGDVARLDAVTAADIKRVAGAYLNRKNLSLIILGNKRTAGPAAKEASK